MGEARWPATFTYLLQPATSPFAFLQATASNLPLSDLPPGRCTLIFHGATQGNQELSSLSPQGVIPFGVDKQVTTAITPLSPGKGERPPLLAGIISPPPWRITATNHHAYAVDICVELPTLSRRGEKVPMQISADPPPTSQKGQKTEWRFTLPPRTTKSITVSLVPGS